MKEAFAKQFTVKDRETEFLIKTRSIPIRGETAALSYGLYSHLWLPQLSPDLQMQFCILKHGIKKFLHLLAY